MIVPFLIGAAGLGALLLLNKKPKETKLFRAEPGEVFTYGIQSDRPFTDAEWRTSVNSITQGGDADIVGTDKNPGGIYTVTLRFKRQTMLYPVGMTYNAADGARMTVRFVEKQPISDARFS